MKRLAHWLMLAGIALGGTARADSDSYMCVGPDYLVLESRSFDSDGQHRLFVHWLDDGIGPRIEVLLPAFQTHGLECSKGIVRIRGWDETHEVDVSQVNRPRYVGLLPSQRADTMDPAARARRVSAWPSGRLSLDQVPGHPYYELLVSNVVETYPGVVETTTVAKLLRRAPDGDFIDSRIIYAGTSIETVD